MALLFVRCSQRVLYKLKFFKLHIVSKRFHTFCVCINSFIANSMNNFFSRKEEFRVLNFQIKLYNAPRLFISDTHMMTNYFRGAGICIYILEPFKYSNDKMPFM